MVTLEIALIALRGDKYDVARTLTDFGITEGTMGHGGDCPIARYIRMRTENEYTVLTDRVVNQFDNTLAYLPSGACDFVWDYDTDNAGYFPAAEQYPLLTAAAAVNPEIVA
jgi:hypothetical protein